MEFFETQSLTQRSHLIFADLAATSTQFKTRSVGELKICAYIIILKFKLLMGRTTKDDFSLALKILLAFLMYAGRQS